MKIYLVFYTFRCLVDHLDEIFTNEEKAREYLQKKQNAYIVEEREYFIRERILKD